MISFYLGIQDISVLRRTTYMSNILLCSSLSPHYDTAGIRKKYHNIQTIEISSLNF